MCLWVGRLLCDGRQVYSYYEAVRYCCLNFRLILSFGVMSKFFCVSQYWRRWRGRRASSLFRRVCNDPPRRACLRRTPRDERTPPISPSAAGGRTVTLCVVICRRRVCACALLLLDGVLSSEKRFRGGGGRRALGRRGSCNIREQMPSRGARERGKRGPSRVSNAPRSRLPLGRPLVPLSRHARRQAGRQDGRPNPPLRPSPPHAAAVTTPKVRGSRAPRFSFCPRSRANPNSSCTLSHART